MIDKINQGFQQLLEEKNFRMKAQELEDEWIYQGKLSLKELHLIGLSVSISKGESYSIAQVIYQKIGYIKDDGQRGEWMEYLNELNLKHGIYYYFCLDEEGYLMARYVTQITHDLENLFQIIVQGTKLLSQVMPELEKRFGTFIVLK